ncbi:diaminobutyrate acetyltransferase [Pseudonocardia acidicola]|uniref:L-2,4-diaminobutyric acid acetyltransferase n=1 Tax=Pseudonocardia acidicola TaxID=2724939 RepID=A0ABX1SEA2_9PSEU|nr:diaminobutyrate acetyltransferase [Pseudonocardia acidicola]NMH99197.1 diaminobutyrate acetyltransferase [Pseudonocardia acidicola]
MIAPEAATADPPSIPPEVSVAHPSVDDGVDMWRLAAESQVLDVNSRYAYLLWCRDFAATSVIARLDGAAVGFVTGYRRPDEPGTLVVWQVAVDAAARGHGIAGRMLDTLFDGVDGVDHLETTITPDNESSVRLFTSFAGRREAHLTRSELFSGDQLGGGHEPEFLYRIGPIKQG